MKKNILTAFVVFGLAFTSNAQSTDTVSIGVNYMNQVWYSLDSNEQATVNGSSWDIGFQINGFSAAILANTAYGAELYKYPNGDTADWATLDTTGINSWTAWHNPSNTWNQGAFNEGIDTSNSLDLGWGNYNFITHNIIGDSIFVWKTNIGTIYKLWIEKLASGIYSFKIADYNGGNLKHRTLVKSNFTGKNFGYYSIANDSIIDLEPVTKKWDLVFSKYMADLGIPYSVTGIRTNIGIQAVQVYPIANTATYDSAKVQNYSSETDIIGHDWKSYDFSCFCYQISDSTVYFVKTDTNTYWKLVMKNFGGSLNGNFIFEKTKINTSTGLVENFKPNEGTFIVYPNPTTNRKINILADLPASIKTAQVEIIDVSGKLVQTETLTIRSSFDLSTIQLNDLNAGIYFLRLNYENGTLTRKLILK